MQEQKIARRGEPGGENDGASRC